MTTTQFKSVLKAQPFRPFTIRMADGRAFPVEHRDFVSLSPSGRIASVFYGDDEHSVLDLLLMSELQVSSGNNQQANGA